MKSRESDSQRTISTAKTFYPFIGSLSDYPRNLTKLLLALKANTFRRSAAIGWMNMEYGAGKDFCRKSLDALRSAGLISYSGKRYELTAVSEEYLDTGYLGIIARSLMENVLGVKEILQVLHEGQPVDRVTLFQKWLERLPTPLARNQFDHRINWLRALGYLELVTGNLLLTENGLKLVAEGRQRTAPTAEEKERVSHSDLEYKLQVIGEFFEFETAKRPSINEVLPSFALKLAEGDRQLDCLWIRYVHFAGKIKFPIEIHLSGNLADTLDRLETVSEFVQKAILITTEPQEQKVIDRLKVKRSRLLDKLVIISVEDVFKAVEAANVLKSFTAKIFAD